MKRWIILAAMLAAGAARAAVPVYSVDLDVQKTTRPFSIKDLYVNDTVTIRANLYEDGTAWSATGWSGKFVYYLDGLHSTGVVSLAGVNMTNYFTFTSSGTTFSTNGNWLCNIVLTNTAGQVKTWGAGNVIVQLSPGSGGAMPVSVGLPLNLNNFSPVTYDSQPVLTVVNGGASGSTGTISRSTNTVTVTFPFGGSTNTLAQVITAGAGNVAGLYMTNAPVPLVPSGVASRQYVDNKVSASGTFYLRGLKQSGVANYRLLDTVSDGVSSTIITNAAPTNNQYLAQWMSTNGVPGLTEVQAGVYRVNIHARAANNTRVKIKAEGYIARANGSTYFEVDDTPLSDFLTTSVLGYTLTIVAPSNIPTLATDRWVIKIKASVPGVSSDTYLYTEGTTDAYLQGQLGTGEETDPVWSAASNSYPLANTLLNVARTNVNNVFTLTNKFAVPIYVDAGPSGYVQGLTGDGSAYQGGVPAGHKVIDNLRVSGTLQSDVAFTARVVNVGGVLTAKTARVTGLLNVGGNLTNVVVVGKAGTTAYLGDGSKLTGLATDGELVAATNGLNTSVRAYVNTQDGLGNAAGTNYVDAITNSFVSVTNDPLPSIISFLGSDQYTNIYWISVPALTNAFPTDAELVAATNGSWSAASAYVNSATGAVYVSATNAAVTVANAFTVAATGAVYVASTGAAVTVANAYTDSATNAVFVSATNAAVTVADTHMQAATNAIVTIIITNHVQQTLGLALPTAEPATVGAIWNSNGYVMVSDGP